MKKILIIFAILISTQSTLCYAISPVPIVEGLTKLAVALSEKAALVTTAAKEAFVTFFASHTASGLMATDATKLAGKTPEQMFGQYEILRTTNITEANWWLYQATMRGSIVAKNELEKQCKQQPTPTALTAYCGAK